MDPDIIKKLIEQGLPDSVATVEGDGRHFEALVVCDAFAGKRLVQQHQLVYQALAGQMHDDAIHALSLRTLTRAAWEQR
ncbi:MAG: BolA family protein [Immundisolibacter sp.]|uniref:BolA family protein n=1 Tax=Immundisolibacter sp. TaxID=1934948 RepID=UPI003EDF4688